MSIHACMSTSLPSESWTRNPSHDMAPGSFIAPAHVSHDHVDFGDKIQYFIGRDFVERIHEFHVIH